MQDKSPFVAVVKQVADELLSNLFTTVTDTEACLKIFDMLILEGIEFAQKYLLGK